MGYMELKGASVRQVFFRSEEPDSRLPRAPGPVEKWPMKAHIAAQKSGLVLGSPGSVYIQHHVWDSLQAMCRPGQGDAVPVGGRAEARC